MKEISSRTITAIINLALKERNLPPATVKVLPIDRGYALLETHTIVLPEACLQRGFEYGLYYALHEVSHLILGREGHGKEFFKVENQELRKWGLKIRRNRGVYVSSIHSLNGQQLFPSKNKGE